MKQQIEACESLLRKQGRSDEEVSYFRKFAFVYTEKTIGMIANHFGMLADLARKNKAKDEDAKAAVTFSIASRFDITDLDTVLASMALTYTAAYKEKVSAEVPVDSPDDYLEDPELPLEDGTPPAPAELNLTPADDSSVVGLPPPEAIPGDALDSGVIEPDEPLAPEGPTEPIDPEVEEEPSLPEQVPTEEEKKVTVPAGDDSF